MIKRATGITGAIIALFIAFPVFAQSVQDIYADIATRIPEFGGIYYSGSVLHINMTEDTPELREAILSELENKIGGIQNSNPPPVFDRVSYGFNQLRDWYPSLRETAFSYQFVTGTGIDEKSNRIEIAVESSKDIATLEQAFRTSGVPQDAIAIVVRGRFAVDDPVEKSTLPMLSILALFVAGTLILIWRFVLPRLQASTKK